MKPPNLNRRAHALKQTTSLLCMKTKLTLLILAAILAVPDINNASPAIATITAGPIGPRGTYTGANSNNLTATLTIAKPTGVVQGDVMIANLSEGTNVNTTILPMPTSPGWTMISFTNIGPGSAVARYGAVLYRIAGATESASNSYTFTLNTNANAIKVYCSGAITAFTNVDYLGGYLVGGSIGGPFDVAPGTLRNDAAAAVTNTPITTVSNNAAVIMVAMTGDTTPATETFASFKTATSPGTLPMLYSYPTGSSSVDCYVGAGWALKATAGATGVGTGTSTQTHNGSMLLALRPLVASKLAFTTQPANTTAGSTMANVVVQLQSASGINVPTNGVSVTLTLSANSFASGTTTLTTDANGAVTFNNLVINTATTGYTITAAATGLTSGTSSSFNITAGAVTAAQSTVTASPGSVTADGTTTSTVTVTLKDAFSNPVSGKTVSLAKNSGPGTPTISAASGSSSASGVVTFTVKSTTAGTDVFAATDVTDSNLAITQTAGVVFTPGAAAKLVFSQQPATTVAGTAISPAVTVYVEDANGNVVTNNSSSVTIGSSTTGFTGGSTLTVAAVNGVATFSAVDPTTAGTANTLTASDGALTGATSNSFTVNAAAASQLVFTTQPSASTVAGVAFAQQPVVKIEDQYGNVVTSGSDSSVSVALTLTTGTGTLGGITSMSAVNGVADFTGKGLNINLVGNNKVLTATVTVTAGTKTTTTSPAFAITFAAASQLVFTTQPAASTVAGIAIATQPVVTIEDQYGNTVTGGADATRSVALTLTTGTGTLGGTISMNAVNGVADFTGKGLSINYVGTDKVLTATAGTKTTTTSPAFAITLPAISILRGPGAGVKIHVSNLLTSDATWDGYGSQAYASSDSTTTNSVSLAISGSGGSTLIVYPSSAANVADAFNYTIIDSNGTRTGTVNIVINTTLTGQAGGLSLSGNGATMTFYGVPGDHYAVQRAGAVSGPWVDITVSSINASVNGTVVTAPAGGAFTVTDGSPPPGNAYYQLRVAP